MEFPWLFLFYFLCNFIVAESAVFQIQLNKNHYNKRLKGYTLLKFENFDLHKCVKKCKSHSSCASFDFHTKERICKLNTVNSSLVQSTEFVDDKGSLFSDISEWSGSLVSGCNEHACGENQMCLPAGENYVCHDIDCQFYPAIEHGIISGTSTLAGSKLYLSCSDGYDLIGHNVSHCHKNATWSTFPRCQIIDCGDPNVTEASYNGTNTTYGQVLQVSCPVGYDLAGDEIIQCGANGSWSDNPTCTIVDCHQPDIPRAEYNTTSTFYGTVREVTCRPGYTGQGPRTITCGADGNWTSTPVCAPPDILDQHDGCTFEVLAVDAHTTLRIPTYYGIHTILKMEHCVDYCYTQVDMVKFLVYNDENKACGCGSSGDNLEYFGPFVYAKNYMFYAKPDECFDPFR